MPSQSETFTYTGELFRPTATQPIDKVLQVTGTRGTSGVTFTADSDYVFTKNVPDGIQWVQGVPARTPDVGTSYTITYELGDPNPNLAFKPGDLIKSEVARDNWSMLFNKLILVPIDTDTGVLAAASGYTLTNLQKAAIQTVAVGNEPVEYHAIVDMFLSEDGEPVLDGGDQVWGRVDVATGTEITVNFYKGAHETPTSVSLTNPGVSMIIPVTTNFHKLPKDFLRTEFINSFESGFAEQTELNQLFRDTGLTKGASAILPTILNHTHTGSSWDDQVNHADLISGGVILHVDIDSWLPTADEKAALSGTDGIPSGGNPYVTDSDPRNSNARTPLSHADTHASSGSDPLIPSGITGTFVDAQNINIADDGGTNVYTFPKIQFDNTGNVDFTITSGTGKVTITADAASGIAPGAHASTHESGGSDIVLLQSLSGTLPISAGGTGFTTATSAFDALAPTTTKGDLIVHNGTDNIRLAVAGTDDYVLVSASGETAGVKWAAPSFTAGTAAGIDNNLVIYNDVYAGNPKIHVTFNKLAVEGTILTNYNGLVNFDSLGVVEGTWITGAWYYIWMFCNDAGTSMSQYLSLHAELPVGFPPGMTKRRRIGAVKCDGSNQPLPFIKSGNITFYRNGIANTAFSGQGQLTVEIDASQFLPEYCRMALINTYFLDSVNGGYSGGRFSEVGQTGLYSLNYLGIEGYASGEVSYDFAIIPVSNDRKFNFHGPFAGTPNIMSIFVVGYVDSL